jgi:branched-chain amino acid transport system permease protein
MKNLLFALVGLALLAALPLADAGYTLSVAAQMLIFAALAMSIDVMAGFAGRTSLCHGALFGVSTYVTVYWVGVGGGSPWTGALLGVLAAGVLAALFGLLAVRAGGVYFLLLTLALGMTVWGVCVRWTSVTGGENGLRASVRPAWMEDSAAMYYVALAGFVILALLMHRFVSSPFGLTLRGIRESEPRMRALGYNVPLHLFIGFVVSGLFAGVAGALYAFFNNFVSPSTVQLSQSVEGLLMAIVGGVGTLLGGLLGSFVVIGLQNVVSLYTERWSMVLGVMFILVMILAPEGLLGKIRKP